MSEILKFYCPKFKPSSELTPVPLKFRYLSSIVSTTPFPFLQVLKKGWPDRREVNPYVHIKMYPACLRVDQKGWGIEQRIGLCPTFRVLSSLQQCTTSLWVYGSTSRESITHDGHIGTWAHTVLTTECHPRAWSASRHRTLPVLHPR